MRYVMFLALIACSGSEKPAEDAGNDDADADTDTDADSDADTDADSGTTDTDTETDTGTDTGTGPGVFPTGYIQSGAIWYQDFPLIDFTNLRTASAAAAGPGGVFDPVAVGFEYVGGILSDGTLVGFRYPGDPADPTQVYSPYILLTFASNDFFAAGSDQDAESCIALAFITDAIAPSATPLTVEPFEAGEDSVHYSYEFQLAIDPSAPPTTCFDTSPGGKLDPIEWGPGGATDLMGSLNGARFGMAFGPHSSYLLNAFGDETIADVDFMESTFTEYIAINDLSGNWVGVDWSFGNLFVWDEATQEVEVGPDDYLVRQPISAF